MVDATLTQVMRQSGVTELDERGLMPLAEARAVIRGVTAFVKGELDHVGGHFVLASDHIWAALLSLGDGAELVEAATRLDWQFQPRGMSNVDLHVRYGDAIVPWLATRVDAAGVLHNHPWCVLPCLLACASAEAFALVWRVRGAKPLASQWIDRHPEEAQRQLVLRAPTDARAAAHLAAQQIRARRGVGGLTPLAVLDAAAARLLGPANLWPALPGDTGPLRGHRLRAIAARDGADWALALERIEGDQPGGMYGARISTFAYGTKVRGSFPGIAVTSRPLAVAGASAPWPEPPELGLPIVAVVEELAHVAPAEVDPDPAALPSASAVFRALAAALA